MAARPTVVRGRTQGTYASYRRLAARLSVREVYRGTTQGPPIDFIRIFDRVDRRRARQASAHALALAWVVVRVCARARVARARAHPRSSVPLVEALWGAGRGWAARAGPSAPLLLARAVRVDEGGIMW